MQLIAIDSPEEELRILKIVKNDLGGFWTSFKEESIMKQVKKWLKCWSKTKCNCSELIMGSKGPKLGYNDCTTTRYSICYRKNVKTFKIEIKIKELEDGECYCEM